MENGWNQSIFPLALSHLENEINQNAQIAKHSN